MVAEPVLQTTIGLFVEPTGSSLPMRLHGPHIKGINGSLKFTTKKKVLPKQLNHYTSP